MVTIPLLGARPLRVTATAVHLAELFFRRADVSGDIYPDDAAKGVVPGPEADRVVVMGERGEISLGVVTNELSMAGFLAREQHEATGRGVEWSIAMLQRDSVADARAAAARRAVDLARTDLVVLMVGISDALRLVPGARWERHVREAVEALFDQLPCDARVAIAEIPPLDNAGSLSRAARVAAGQRAAALNRRTRAVAADHPRLVVVPFPRELTERLWVPQSEELRYTRTYAVWSREIVATLVGART
ncbi:SGNH/GDSL hydrolase family protein [Frigoribacterium salinisoli]